MKIVICAAEAAAAATSSEQREKKKTLLPRSFLISTGTILEATEMAYVLHRPKWNEESETNTNTAFKQTRRKPKSTDKQPNTAEAHPAAPHRAK